jgi:phospholipid transport system substrate-binding protein
MKNIYKILLLLMLVTSSLFALQKETLKEEMETEINKVQVILQNKDFTKEKKKEEIIKIIDKVFDYSIMARISLGKKWKNISKEQRAEFSKLFEHKIKHSYVDKLNLYTDEEVTIGEVTSYKKTRLILNTQIIGKSDTYVINYKFYNNKKKKTWLVYDVDIIGVSIIQTYRKQFAGLLKEKSFDELIEVLKSKN